jgi:hypothetical protein
VIVLRLALLPLIPLPTPAIHDEFSTLLGAETFAAGRLSNPTPPAWQHLETFHVNMRPTYHSMYPPAQFLFPALGLVVTKNAWLGVLLGVAAMCSAITWMLRGWFPARWALLGGLWTAWRFGIFSYWVNSYWGGAMAALAGALVLGALPRLLLPIDEQRSPGIPVLPPAPHPPQERESRAKAARNAVLLALGLLLLANSRPVEGLLFSLPLLVYLLLRLLRRAEGSRRRLRLFAPAVLLLLFGAGWMLYYNVRTVGSPWQLPYLVNLREYHISKPYLWQSANSLPAYRHESMRRFYFFHELPDYLDSRHGWGKRLLVERNAAIFYFFFLCPISLLMLAGWLALLRRGGAQRVMAVAAMSASLPLLVELWPPHGHYAAPALGAYVAMALAGLRVMRTVRFAGARFGLMLARAVVVLLVVVLLAATAARIMNPLALDDGSQMHSIFPLQVERDRLENSLLHTPGRHLVIVHYEPEDIPAQEWIANQPDPSSASIVWARDMGPEANQRLLDAYPGRHVWCVNRSHILLQAFSHPRQ